MMFHLCAAICAATASGLARNAAAALSSDAARVQRGTPGYEALLEKNWVGNVEFGSAKAIVPASLEELESAVRGAQAPEARAPPHKENTPVRTHARVVEDSGLRVHVCSRHYTRGRKRRPIPVDVALIVNSSHNAHGYVDLTVRSDRRQNMEHPHATPAKQS